MTLQQRENDKNQPTFCYISEAQILGKGYLPSTNQIQVEISKCLQKSQQLTNEMSMFCQQYKKYDDEISKLEEKLLQKRKKHGFKKNHQIPTYQEVQTNKKSYFFTPTIIYN